MTQKVVGDTHTGHQRAFRNGRPGEAAEEGGESNEDHVVVHEGSCVAAAPGIASMPAAGALRAETRLEPFEPLAGLDRSSRERGLTIIPGRLDH